MRSSLAVVVGCAAFAGLLAGHSLSAQQLSIIPRTSGGFEEPKPLLGQPVATWQAVKTSRTTQGQSELKVLYARNDTTVPIAVIRVRLSNCVNTQLACDALMPKRDIMMPGQILRIADVAPVIGSRPYSLHHEVDWRVARECIGISSSADSTALVPPLEPPQIQFMIIPPVGAPRALRDATVTVTFFIGPNGRPDSVQVDSIPDRSYRDKVRKTMSGYLFLPPIRLGCPTASTTKMTVTF